MHTKNYSLLVFDWDGTLVDSEKLVVDAIQKIAGDFGHKVPSTDKVRQNFGKNLEGMLEPFFPKEKHAHLTEAFYNHFKEERLITNFFEDAIDTLTHLKQEGFTLAIATNRPRADLNKALTAANIWHLFATTRCPEDGELKPHPSMLLTLLEELQHDPKNTLMIGDSAFDMQFAQNAGVDALAACYGHNRKKHLSKFNPVGYIDHISELKNILTPPQKANL
ncbi:MAG: HAD-IIIA family hydrolase [Gammaproteobacteria bacterium]|nr:HAD-IIIA family hydrolase [Gammaproteobacteria bacterium]